MTRMVCFNDPHLSQHAPECRADTYPLEILAKLHEVALVAKRVKAQVIGCTGDWFHRKGRTTFREQTDLLAVLSGWRRKGFDVVGILGNHDIAGHSLDSLDNRAVGAMVHSKILHLLDHTPYEGKSEDGKLYVTGTSYFHGCDANDEARVRMYGAKRPGKSGVHVHLAHGTLLQRGTFFEDYTVAGDLIELLHEHHCLPDVIVCGHLHFNEGIRLYERPDGSGSVAVCRVGSVGRVDRTDLDRQILVTVIACKGDKFACKAVPIGSPVERIDQSASRGGLTVAEHEDRIKDFVRVLRSEAEDFELANHTKLLQTIADKLGYGDQVYRIALRAVEDRQ